VSVPSPAPRTEQLLMFEIEQVRHADGSFTVKPKRLTDGREVTTRQAAKMLGLHRQTVSDLCQLGAKDGGLEAWKTQSKRGNAKWRIAWQSVMDYKSRRAELSREGR
jgi:excisionase family DNA binding protein